MCSVPHTHTHTHTRLTALCPGLPGWAGTRKVKPNLDFTEARDSEWQWHQLGHMQVCTSLQTDNHASTQPLSFYRPNALPAAQPTVCAVYQHKFLKHMLGAWQLGGPWTLSTLHNRLYKRTFVYCTVGTLFNGQEKGHRPCVSYLCKEILTEWRPNISHAEISDNLPGMLKRWKSIWTNITKHYHRVIQALWTNFSGEWSRSVSCNGHYTTECLQEVIFCKMLGTISLLLRWPKIVFWYLRLWHSDVAITHIWVLFLPLDSGSSTLGLGAQAPQIVARPPI